MGCAEGMHPIWGCTWAQRQLRAESPCLACLLPQITNPSAMPQSPLRSRPLGRGFFQGRARLRPQHASKQSQLGRRFQSSWAGPGQGGGKGAVPSTCACQELLAGLPTTGTLQPCPVPALSAHEHGHLWGTGSTSQNSTGSPCGAAVVVLVPPSHNWGASPGLCPLLRAETGPSSASRQPPQGFWPHDRSRGCPPLPGALPTPVPPQSQWDGDLPEQAQLATEGRGCVCLGLGVGVGAGAGLLGWVRSVPWRFVSPAPCPDTQPQAFVGIRK